MIIKNLHTIKWKIIIPSLLILIVSSVLLASVLAGRFVSFNDESFYNQLTTSVDSIKRDVEAGGARTKIAAVDMSIKPEVINAVREKDRDALLELALNYLEFYDVSYFTISDANGNVIMRSYQPESFGDSLMGQQNAVDALNGTVSSYFEGGDFAKVSVRSGSPVYGEGGEIIGVVSAGFRMDTDEFVDEMKTVYGVDVTIFEGDTRVNSTVMNGAERNVGSRLTDEAVLDAMFNQGVEYMGETTIAGIIYRTIYVPMFDPGNEVFAVLGASVNRMEIIAASESFVTAAAVVALIAIVVSTIVLFLVVGTISRPIIKLSGTLRDLADGIPAEDINIKSKDEVGSLAESVLSVSETVKNLSNEIAETIANYDTGHDREINEGIFEGCYKEIAVNMNKMNKDRTDDFTEILRCVKAIADGNLNVNLRQMPGERRAANDTIDTIKKNLKLLHTEVLTLSNAVVNGDLAARSDSSQFMGSWKDLAESVNNLLEMVSKPFEALAVALGEMAAGKMQTRITGDFKGDYGKMKDQFNTTMQEIFSYVSEVSEILTEMAENDFTRSISREYIGDLETIRESTNRLVSVINRVLTDIGNSTDQVFNGANQISSSSAILADGAQNQATAVQMLETSMKEVSEKIVSISESAGHAKALSSAANDSAVTGGKSMQKMQDAMNKIAESSQSIRSIMKVIDDIAFQTNLLALNASVEAARAGDYGKGFAVVADEVRSLAQQSKHSSGEIAKLIEDAIEKVNDGVKFAKETAEDLGHISEEITNISDIVTQVSEKADEQVKRIQENSQNIQMISETTFSNASVAEETASASQELTSVAQVFQETVRRFKLRGEL